MRVDGWEKRLNEHLETIGAFAWGTNDCCMFAVGCVQAMTGVDHGKEFRGYKTAVGAAKRLEKHGGVEGIATYCLGESKSVKLAKRGDVVMIDSGEGYALGVCVGSKIAAVSKDGLTFVPMTQAIKVWSI